MTTLTAEQIEDWFDTAENCSRQLELQRRHIAQDGEAKDFADHHETLETVKALALRGLATMPRPDGLTELQKTERTMVGMVLTLGKTAPRDWQSKNAISKAMAELAEQHDTLSALESPRA